MNVADLRQHLADLGKLMASSGAKPVAADLAAICDGLAPFEWVSLKDFAAFLVRADAYSRGEVPVVPPKKARKVAGPTQVAPDVDVEAICREMRDLYDRAADPTTTAAIVDGTIGKLNGLKKDDLIQVAAAIELKVAKSKKAGDIIAAIRQRVIARKGATQRAGLLDRPASGGDGVDSDVGDAEHAGHR